MGRNHNSRGERKGYNPAKKTSEVPQKFFNEESKLDGLFAQIHQLNENSELRKEHSDEEGSLKPLKLER